MDCFSRAHKDSGKITDGKHMQFRCFAASQEAAFSSVRKSRWRNFELLKDAKTIAGMKDLIMAALPRKSPYVRVHVSGDFFNQNYFDAWMSVARECPDQVFYSYTKSLHIWKKRLPHVPSNFRLNASRGGKFDTKIKELDLVEAVVILHPEEAGDMEIDHDDSHARSEKRENFALIIHGIQPKGSKGAEAIKRLKNEEIKFAYTRK